jgi:hypothetical protein
MRRTSQCSRHASAVRSPKAKWLRDFSTTKAAFDPKLWDPGDENATLQDPGDNTPKFRTIVSLLRP